MEGPVAFLDVKVLIALLDLQHLSQEPAHRWFQIDVAPGNWSRVNESPHPARLGRGLHHETHPRHARADDPQTQKDRAVNRPRQDRL